MNTVTAGLDIDVHTRLTAAINDMVMVSLLATCKEREHGQPCYRLIESIFDGGSAVLAKKLIQAGADEFSLTLPLQGLTLIRLQKGHFYVGGGQYSFYPTTGPALNKALATHGLHPNPARIDNPVVIMAKAIVAGTPNTYALMARRTVDELTAFVDTYNGPKYILQFYEEKEEGTNINYIEALRLLQEALRVV